jgi:hypothetical protein
MNLLFEVPNFGPKHRRGVVLRVRQALAGGLSAIFALTSVGSIPTVTQAKVRPVAAAMLATTVTYAEHNGTDRENRVTVCPYVP